MGLFCRADVDALHSKISRLEAEIVRLRSIELEAQFRAVRQEWAGMGGWPELDINAFQKAKECIPREEKWQMTMNGSATWLGMRVPRPRRKRSANGTIDVNQVSSVRVQELLTMRNEQRPVWTPELFSELSHMQRVGSSLSPPCAANSESTAALLKSDPYRHYQSRMPQIAFPIPNPPSPHSVPSCIRHYPHAAEDIMLAFQRFVSGTGADFGGRETGSGRGIHQSIAVWSSLSPWIESALLNAGARELTTIDYNPPEIIGGNAPIRSLGQAELPKLYAASQGKGAFSTVISFSGLEHDGLGRYGDPLNPTGDIMAMREIRLLLRRGGILLLGVPTASTDELTFPVHRVYGPKRLRLLLGTGFTMLARVWDGVVVRGGLEQASEQPPLFARKGSVFRRNESVRTGEPYADDTWQHQQILVLRRKDD